MKDQPSLELLLRKLRLPTIIACHVEVALAAEKNGWSFGQYLHHLVETEVRERSSRRIERNLKRSGLPADKTLETLDTKRLPVKVRRILPTLCKGGSVERAENILAFGNPGTGKSHLVSAIGHELVQRGYQVLYVPAYRLVQRLLVAKRELVLEKVLKRLDAFDAVVLDDIGYIQQDQAEMEVLFTFLAERYERRTVMITSNLLFSQWDRIFKDPMTTAAAIDRLVHHSTIVTLRQECLAALCGPGVRCCRPGASSLRRWASQVEPGVRSAGVTCWKDGGRDRVSPPWLIEQACPGSSRASTRLGD